MAVSITNIGLYCVKFEK